MSKTLRVVLAAIAAILLVGLAPAASVSPMPDWHTAGPDAPEGG